MLRFLLVVPLIRSVSASEFNVVRAPPHERSQAIDGARIGVQYDENNDKYKDAFQNVFDEDYDEANPNVFLLTIKHSSSLKPLMNSKYPLLTLDRGPPTLYAVSETNSDRPPKLKFTVERADKERDAASLRYKIRVVGLDPCRYRLVARGQLYAFNFPIQFPTRRCQDCWSKGIEASRHEEHRHNSTTRYLVARHGEVRADCGGRACSCNNGQLTCDEHACVHRKEYGMLAVDDKGYDEKQVLIDAFRYINAQCDGSQDCGTFYGTSDAWGFNTALQHHMDHSSHAHGNSKFLPWHRQYLWEWEQKLQRFHACVTLPYWDWTEDAGNEANAHVYDPSYFGDHESELGQFDGWQLPAGWGLFSRAGGGSWGFASDAAVANLMGSPSYSTFRSGAEGSPHVGPHVLIGGQMGNFRSPSDPFFWMHHAMVDKLWFDWQRQAPANQFAYDNVASAPISPQWSRPVSDMFDSEHSVKVCYDDPPIIIGPYTGLTRIDFLQVLKRTDVEHFKERLDEKRSETVNAFVADDCNPSHIPSEVLGWIKLARLDPRRFASDACKMELAPRHDFAVEVLGIGGMNDATKASIEARLLQR